MWIIYITTLSTMLSLSFFVWWASRTAEDEYRREMKKREKRIKKLQELKNKENNNGKF